MSVKIFVGVLSFGVLFLVPSIVLADNCSFFTDCFRNAQAAAAAATALAILATILSTALDFTPGVGQVKGIIEAGYGYDLLTQEKLSKWERISGIVPYAGKGSAKLLRLATKLAETSQTAGRLQKAASIVDKGTRAYERYQEFRDPYDKAQAIKETADSVANHLRDYLNKTAPPPSQTKAPSLNPSQPVNQEQVGNALKLAVAQVPADAPKDILEVALKKLIKEQSKNSPVLKAIQKLSQSLNKLPEGSTVKDAIKTILEEV